MGQYIDMDPKNSIYIDKYRELCDANFTDLDDTFIESINNYNFTLFDWDSYHRHDPLNYDFSYDQSTTLEDDVKALKIIAKKSIDVIGSGINNCFTSNEKENIFNLLNTCSNNNIDKLANYFSQKITNYEPCYIFKNKREPEEFKEIDMYKHIPKQSYVICLDFDNTCVTANIGGRYDKKGLDKITLCEYAKKIISENISNVAICSFSESIHVKYRDCIKDS